MSSQTPKFDKALGEYFSKLELDGKGGQWRTCRFSGEKFYVRAEDIAFYKKIGVPLPTLHPDERWRRLLAYQNSFNLFHVKSAFTGKTIIAAYSPNTPYKIYEHTEWYGGTWNPLEYGQAYESGTQFFGQFEKLQRAVPRPNLMNDSTNVGSDYTNMSNHLKNCYLTFNSAEGENLYYIDYSRKTKDALFGNATMNCDTCYECRVLVDAYRCFLCEESRNCMESKFLFDCRNCEHCFMCANLRSKKYCWENEQLSKDEYERRLAKVNLGDRSELSAYRRKFAEMRRQARYKPDHNFKSTNVEGDFFWTSKNCTASFYIENSENVHYSLGLFGYRDSYDVMGGLGGELCYELMTVSSEKNYNIRFSSQIDQSRNMEYSDLCRNSHDCFGCVGLANKSFCILNRQYAEDEYWPMVDGIKTAMLEAGEYGEFFPPALSPVPYKLSFALSYGAGFTDIENAEAYGYDVSDPPAPETEGKGEIISSRDLPQDIKDVDDSILAKVIFDEKNKKQFRITPYELAFYRRHAIALPREHPLERMREMRSIYPLKLRFWERTCPSCKTSFKSVHDPEEYANVLCEPCYNGEVA